LYARHGHLAVCATRGEALAAAVRAWDEDGRDGLIVTDASNAERHRANGAAQTLRLLHGELGEEAVRGQGVAGEVAFRVGDPVIFTRQWRPRGDRRIENGTTGQ